MKNNGLNKVVSKYFNQSLGIRIESFNLMVIVGIIAMAAIAAINIVKHSNIMAIVIDVVAVIFLLVLLHYVETKKCYRAGSLFIVAAIFCVAFPALFFYRAGNRGGMVSFFILAVIFTSILLDSRDKIIALAVEITIYISCFMVNYIYPDIAYAYPSEVDYLIDELMGFSISVVIILFIIMTRDRMIEAARKRVNELNRELQLQNETLAQYDSMKSDFLATVAHEIKTPLAVISASCADTIDIIGDSPVYIENAIENQLIIDRKVKLIDNILVDLMDTVAIERGRLLLSRRRINLAELTMQICDIQFKKLDTNNNTLQYNIPPNLPDVYADPTRIQQVLINLLSNSCQYTKNGIITVNIEQTENCQVVSVSDTGEGMDEEMTRIVLKQFVSTKEDYWRHGIGLYICRRIISAHGGDLRIDSEKGRGTKISFTLNEETGNGRSNTKDTDS